LLTQVLIEPRGERAAEDRVQHLERRVFLRRAWHADPADADLRLGSARLVDQIDLSSRQLRRIDDVRARTWWTIAAPAAKRLLHERHDAGGGDVANDNQCRVVGPIVRRIERAEIVQPHLLERRFGADGRRAIAVPRAKDETRKRETYDLRRIVTRLQHRRQP